jgi:hypothetical protein
MVNQKAIQTKRKFEKSTKEMLQKPICCLAKNKNKIIVA